MLFKIAFRALGKFKCKIPSKSITLEGQLGGRAFLSFRLAQEQAITMRGLEAGFGILQAWVGISILPLSV